MPAEDRPNGDGTAVSGRTPRVNAPKLARAIVALGIGLLITFSATMHEQYAFDRAVVVIALLVFAVAHVYAWWAGFPGRRDPVSLILAVVSLATAILLPFIGTVAGLAVVLAAWALVNGLFEFVGAATRPGSRQDSTVLGALGILLALAALLVHRDLVAIIGFFGAYSLIVGVFLGISAFDQRGQASRPSATDLRPHASQESAR